MDGWDEHILAQFLSLSTENSRSTPDSAASRVEPPQPNSKYTRVSCEVALSAGDFGRSHCGRLSAYRIRRGLWTLGVGDTAAAGEPKPVAGMKLTLEQAISLLRREIAKYDLWTERD